MVASVGSQASRYVLQVDLIMPMEGVKSRIASVFRVPRPSRVSWSSVQWFTAVSRVA